MMGPQRPLGTVKRDNSLRTSWEGLVEAIYVLFPSQSPRMEDTPTKPSREKQKADWKTSSTKMSDVSALLVEPETMV